MATAEQENPLVKEIDHVIAKSRSIIEAYVGWKQKIKYDNYNTMYGDLIDFVNFRIETADSCLQLIESHKIADSLGLSRSLLENYLLLILMCRGDKYFQLQDLSALSEGDFKKQLLIKQQELKDQRKAGKTKCLAVEKYPRAKRHLMYIFEGLEDPDIPDYHLPLHFFQFKDFNPDNMRFNDEDYFQYYEPGESVKKARKSHKQVTAHTYRHYLSYDALLQNLLLNGLVDEAGLLRIEAHYTFLGRFLHPTHEAARSLHIRNNYYNGETRIGMEQSYTYVAALLAALYVCFSLAGIVEEMANMFEAAPTKFIKDAGTNDVRTAIATVDTDYSYFWFIFNQPPDYDRYIYCIHHATDEELKKWGGYKGVPNDRVTFQHNIYGHLQHALSGQENVRCDKYAPKLASL